MADDANKLTVVIKDISVDVSLDEYINSEDKQMFWLDTVAYAKGKFFKLGIDITKKQEILFILDKKNATLFFKDMEEYRFNKFTILNTDITINV